jgi:ABC-2 type transport system permease protein
MSPGRAACGSTRRSGREALTFLRLLGIHLRLGILNELQYRTNLFIQLIQSAVGLLTALLGLAVVFSKTDSLGGWSAPELLAIVGVYTLVSGITQLVVQPSLARFMEDVRLGTLDFTLTKPVDAQVLISVRQVEIWKLVDVVVGLVVLGVAIGQLGATVGLAEAVAFLIALLAGVTIIYSFLLILATCVFWFIRLDNILNIFQSMYEAGKWPIGIYPPWLRTMLTFLVPIGFAITVPAEGLVGRLTSPNLLGAIALAVVLPLIARVFWRIGVRHYSGASA